MATQQQQQPAINILIGVGGTGAKVVEATLIQLLAGMIDNPVYVGFVDQDAANGNVTRASELLSQQRMFRQIWSNPTNRIDWASGELAALGHNGIHSLFQDNREVEGLFSPNAAGTNLQEMLSHGLTGPQQHLFNMLFMNSVEEQLMPLDEGYRGRAHVGSAAFISSLTSGRHDLFEAIERITESSGGKMVNVFFAGSAFGGTGAAGFPTLARQLAKLRKNRAFTHAENIRIGGLLMLPYFNFDPPDDAEDVVVTPDELLPKTQMALNYYHDLFKHEEMAGGGSRSFDLFYTLGWPDQYPLGYHERGTAKQANPAIPTEMFGATAAIHFFRQMDNYVDATGTVRFLSAHEEPWIHWRDLPNDSPLQQEMMLRLGQLLRFCTYWRYKFVRELSEPLSGLFKRHNAAQKLASKVHPTDAEEEMKALDRLIASILNWFASTEAMAGRVRGGQRMWTMQRLLDGTYDGSDPCEPVRLELALDTVRVDRAFNELIVREESGIEGRTAANIYEELVEATEIEAHEGIGKAVVQVYNACRLNEEGSLL